MSEDDTGGPNRRISRRAAIAGAGVIVAAAVAGGVIAVGSARRGTAHPSPSAAAVPRPKGELVHPLLAKRGFTIGHHGGSLDWPEMSRFGYERAAAAGVDALEVSLARSADGVWFGLHDATLDRTSGTSGFVAAEHPWSEIETHLISAAETKDASQPSRPYARFTDIMRSFGATHTLFVDPKVVDARFYPELFALFEKHLAHPRDSVVAKGYCTQTVWGEQAAARGYTTWGYYYGAEIVATPTLLSSTASTWDLLGLDYSAAADQWATVLALQKPVIGHVVPSLAAGRTALDLGAAGLMISGVTEARALLG